MIKVHIIAELEADEYGPHEVYAERLELPEGWAKNASEAHARLLTLLVTESYVELPTRDSWVPFRTETIRSLVVWDARVG